MREIILASGSPRRKDILEELKIPFRVQVSDFDEDSVSLEGPIELVKKLAIEKAKSVAKESAHSIVIGADTVVVYQNKILGKPVDENDAFNHLVMLSNDVHLVYTGIALVSGDNIFVDYACTKVYFNKLSDQEIDSYVKTKEPLDKAGSYGIQGLGRALVNKIDGDYYNVVGLPVSKLIEGLQYHHIDYFNTFL